MIPPQFNEEFLTWFRNQTEATWRDYETATLKDYYARGVGGDDWQRGTRWLAGLSEQEIATIERHWKLQFPPDYRLFLKMLHSVDKPLSRARYVDSNKLAMMAGPSFYNWQTENALIEQAYEKVIDGIFFDVQHNNVWFKSWGEKPTTEEAQRATLRELVAAAPRLVPIFGHRFLLAEPCRQANPVLSIHQTDIIVYSPNLYYYFFGEFSDLLDVDEEELEEVFREDHKKINEQYEQYKTIPFWGEFL